MNRIVAIMAIVLAGALNSWSIEVTDVQVATPTPAPQYEKVELVVSLSGVSATRFYEPDPTRQGLDMIATFTSPTAQVRTVNGFYDGVSHQWLVRFAPTETGAWTFAVSATDAGGTDQWTGGSFQCAASAHPGFARIDGRYLRFSNGQALFAIGHNNGWQFDLEQPGFAEMAAGGENLLSFWINTPWARPRDGYEGPRAPLENATDGLGTYSPEPCAYLDGLLQRAEAADVYLLPSIWTHGQLRQDGTHPWGDGYWENNPYQTVCAAADFFKTSVSGTETAQWRYQKNYYRYLLARWGYSRAIVGWVTLVEMDGSTPWYAETGTMTGTHPIAQAWCAAVRQYFADHDACRLVGGKYPMVTSRTDYYSGYYSWATGEDLRAVDCYSQAASDINVAKSLADQTRYMLAADAPSKPAFHAEFGWDFATQPLYVHNGIWGGTSAGAAMTPLIWCDGDKWPLLTDPEVGEGMRNSYARMAEFLQGVPYQCDADIVQAGVSLSPTTARGWGMRLSDRGFAWLQKTSGLLGGETLTFTTLTNGLYRVSWYDVWLTGLAPAAVQSDVRVENGSLVVTVPLSTTADLAVRVERTGDLPVEPVKVAGVTAEFFDYTSALSQIPDLSGRTADVTRIDSQINYASTTKAWSGLGTQFKDTFASRHTGYLKITTAGSYTLYINSDEGSKVYLDGQLLINNDGLHTMLEKSATVSLTAGYHSLRVEYFENTGSAGLILSWIGPGIRRKTAVPATALWHDE